MLVGLSWLENALEISVTDDGRGPAPSGPAPSGPAPSGRPRTGAIGTGGHGLIGIRERATACGGTATTTFDLDEYVYDALYTGASGFLLKDVRRDDLVHAVRVVAAGESLLAPSVTRR